MTTEQNIDSPDVDLKQARESLGLTLKELFERTRISVANLEAIEKGNFHLLPVPIYTRNFIKTYADALGVDAQPVLDRYENYLKSLLVKEKAEADQQSRQSPLSATLSRHKTLLWFACIIIIFAAVYLLATHARKTPVEVSPAQPEAPGAKATAPETAPPITADLFAPENIIAPQPVIMIPGQTEGNTEQSPADAGQEENEKSSTLVIRATQETWIRIQSDDKEPFQVLLRPGQKMAQKAKSFKVDIGNAGGVQLQLDGKSIENLGKSGQVIHLSLP